MTGALVLLATITVVVTFWVIFRIVRVRRRHRAGFGIGDEERRLRDDPRFTELWVKQLPKNEPPAGSGTPSA